MARIPSLILRSLAIAVVVQASASADPPREHAAPGKAAHRPAGKAMPRAELDRAIADWSPKARAVAYQVMRRYGPPHAITDAQLVWFDVGPWRRTVVHRDEVVHDFPYPHTDVLEQVILARVPIDKLDDLARFDGSITFDRTTGELASSADQEAMNLIALNLAHQIYTGKLSVEDARARYGKDVRTLMTSDAPPASATELAFTPDRAAGDPDKVTLAGAPQPGSLAPGLTVGDPEVIGALVVANMNEVELARLALRVSKNDKVLAFARMLEKDHGEGLRKALDLGPAIKVTPTENVIGAEMKQGGEDAMAKLAPLEGAAFDRAFLQIAVEAHQQTLDALDKKLAPAAKNRLVADAVAATRVVVAHHLEEAKALRGHETRTSRR
ncbi:MAG: DUF4142 domain-containing protein [Deltaproteobacteria bacterium]|nr:DUF4142 domain-containing protein [Deltaproteobacteria bacterium]